MDTRLIVYVKDEAGQDMPHASAFERRLIELGAWHQTPGLGLGRECPGFINRLEFATEEGSSMGFITNEGKPLRISLYRPGTGTVGNYWLVAPNMPRGEVDRLRSLSWPKANAP